MVNLRRAPGLSLLGLLLAGSCQDPPTTGTLIVNVTGLPAGATAVIRVLGPNQFFQMVGETVTLPNLVPGEYILVREPVNFSPNRYAVSKLRDTVAIVRGQTETANVDYAIASGSLNLTIAGITDGSLAAVVVRGSLDSASQGFNEGVFESRTITGLLPGRYEIRSDTTFTFAGDKFAASKRFDTVTVVASVTPVAASVNYTLASGTIELSVTGLPGSFSGQPITITGPGGYFLQTWQSRSLRGLAAGTYTIVAENVSNTCPNTYTTANSQQSIVVDIGQTSPASIVYDTHATTPDQLNLRIERAYLTQATQNPDGTVPILAGKTALLRVFGTANQCNDVKPKVRVTLSTGTQVTLEPAEDSVRRAAVDAVPTASWNYVVPANVVQPGLTVQAEIDPANQVPEANEGDNAQTISPVIRNGPVVALRFVPIHQSAVNLTGNVNAGNADAFLAWPRKLYPVETFDFDIRETYTTNRTLDPCSDIATTGKCDSWAGVISELRAVRTADQSNRYYYGIVRLNYTPGVYGIASDIPSFAAMGWDATNFGGPAVASENVAHELGHSFGRRHSPCGGAGGPDPAYPYNGGRIGVLGWHPLEGFKHPGLGDVMGYCSPTWISDYTYMGVWNRIQNEPGSVAGVAAAESPSLLVWGTISAGQISLEPVFEISSSAQLPAPGPHRIALLDERGAEITSASFSAERIADLPGDVESFAFTIPSSALRGQRLASLRLTAKGRTVTAVASGDLGSDPGAVVTRVGARGARIQWDATRFPVVMVRNPANGRILSFARGGDATIVTSQSQLDLNFSNRVGSTRRLRALR